MVESFLVCALEGDVMAAPPPMEIDNLDPDLAENGPLKKRPAAVRKRPAIASVRKRPATADLEENGTLKKRPATQDASYIIMKYKNGAVAVRQKGGGQLFQVHCEQS